MSVVTAGRPATGPNPLVTRLTGPIEAVRRGARVVFDALLPIALGLFLVSLVGYGAEHSAEPVPEPLRLLGLVAGLGQGIALYWRRSHPRTVTAIAVLGGAVIQLIAPAALFPYAGMVALWSLATTQAPRFSLPGLAGLLGVTALSWPDAVPFGYPATPPVPAEDTGFALAVVVAVWALAEALRSRRAAVRQASRQAAEHEQARLARELHDVIAHSVSVIVVQAAAGDDVFDHDPAAARQALRSIEAAGRESLAELRRLLAATGPAEPSSETGSAPGAALGSALGDDRRPQPDLSRLDDLADPLRAVGLTVQIQRLPPPGPGRPAKDEVPAGVQLSAYRIVQEALTNVVRHAGADRVEVRLETIGDQIEISVTDNGAAARTGFRPGRGITGMRERAALLGGTLQAGPRPERGFQVLTRLPLAPGR